MSNTLRIKRRASGNAGAPGSLANAELAFNEVDDILYYGKGTGGAGGTATTVEAIGGKGAMVTLTGDQTVAGIKTFSSSPVLPTPSTSDNSTKAATTAYVKAQGYALGSTTISTAANSGLAGGGDLSGNRTLSLDINNLTTVTSSASTDYIAIYDGAGVKKITKGNFVSNLGGGTVTSVDLSAPSIFTVSGNPVTGSGTLTLGLASQTQNYVWASPNGSNGTPTFRALVAADIPTLTAVKISDFDTQVRTSRLDQMAAPTASVSLNSQKITNLATPTLDTDAATKAYVDAARSGLDVKQSVRVASTAAVTVTYTATGGTSARGQITAAPNTLDGVSLAANDRILLKDQSTGAQNGIYVVSTLGTGSNGVWDRATDADSDAEVTAGLFTFVTEGTVNADSGWVLTTNDTITLGGASGTALAFAQFSGAGQITAGAGLTKSGNTLDVGTASSSRIVVNADNLDLATTGVSASTYRSVTVDVYGRVTGGTNPTTLSGYGITDAQPLDATLTALAGVTTSSDLLIYATGSDTFSTTSFTAFGRSLVDDADAATARTTLGLGTMATQAASNVGITGGSITNLTTFDGVTIDGGTF